MMTIATGDGMSVDSEARTAVQRRIEELHALLEQGIREGIGVGASLGVQVESLAKGRAVYRLDPSPATINALFTVHGGVLATLMDTAMGSAVYTALPDGVLYTTLELKVNFIRAVSADGPRLTCTAETVHVGRRSATAQATVLDAGGRLIAHGTCTCMLFGQES
jgi:acyl-CoA thioesterase